MATCQYINAKARAALAALCIALLGPVVFGAEAVTVDGKRLEGALKGDGANVAFSSASGATPLSQIARVTYQPPLEPAQLVSGVKARDGSIVRGAVTLAKDSVSIASPSLGKLTIATSSIAEIYFDCRQGLPDSGALGVMLVNGDFVAVGEGGVTLSATQIKARSTMGDVEIPVERIAALRVAVPVGDVPGASAIMLNGDVVDGRLVSASAETVAISGAFGEIKAPASDLVEVDFPARIRYLSDLPLSVKTQGITPEGVAYLARDGGTHGLLESPAGRYRKGLVTRAGAAVTVELPAGTRTLEFVPVLAKGANPPAGRFAVLAGGKELWAKAVTAGSDEERVSISPAGATSVTLTYMSTPEGLIGSCGVWGDAFVTIQGK